jgi:protein MpaA
MRDYVRDVVDRVNAGEWPAMQMGETAGLPLLSVTAERQSPVPTVYVNGGTHGDEPAGLEAALRFLESRAAAWTDRFRFEVIPCLNPTGYVSGSRANVEGVDLNWAYHREELPEIAMIRHFIEDRRFEVVVDLHEDWESPGYYIYEQFRDLEPVGRRVTDRVAQVCPINRSNEIEGEIAEEGVIFPNPDAEKRVSGQGIPIELFKQGFTSHLLTSETPTEQPLEVRVEAHLVALEAILESRAR